MLNSSHEQGELIFFLLSSLYMFFNLLQTRSYRSEDGSRDHTTLSRSKHLVDLISPHFNILFCRQLSNISVRKIVLSIDTRVIFAYVFLEKMIRSSVTEKSLGDAVDDAIDDRKQLDVNLSIYQVKQVDEMRN